MYKIKSVIYDQDFEVNLISSRKRKTSKERSKHLVRNRINSKYFFMNIQNS